MSDLYVLEPPTHGRVILNTTHGPLDIVLWSKECPKACLNFVQLCIDGYYDKCLFHLVIPSFIVQTGDPTGTGCGGESIYVNEGFPLEAHPRLLFRYRGLLGLASLTPDAEISRDPDITTEQVHGSQFFITLGPAPGLNRKHTLFGKVVGDSLYNLLNLAETPIDKNNRPLEPPSIKGVEVILNPFPCITPRANSRAALQLDANNEALEKAARRKKRVPREVLRSKKKDFLSFEIEEEDDDTSLSTTWDITERVVVKDNEKKELPDCSSARLTKVNDLKERIQHHVKETRATPPMTIDECTEEANNEDNDEESSDDETESEETELRVNKVARRSRRKLLSNLESKILSFKKGEGTVEQLLRQKDSVQDADLLGERVVHPSEHGVIVHGMGDVGKTTSIVFESSRSKSESAKGIRDKFRKFQKLLIDQRKNEKHEVDDTENDDTLWYSGSGLRFAVDSARAYELDASNDAVSDPQVRVCTCVRCDQLAVFDPLSGKPEEAAQKLKKLRSDRLKPSLKPGYALL